MKFTARGLIYVGYRVYAKSWEDLFQLNGRDTPKKKRTFKEKYRDEIKEVTFESKRGKETYMIALQSLAENKTESDLQKLARGESATEIRTNAQQTLESMVRNRLGGVYHFFRMILVEEGYSDRLMVSDNRVLTTPQGDLILSAENIYMFIEDSIMQDITANSYDIAQSLFYDTIFRFERDTTMFKMSKDREKAKEEEKDCYNM